MGKQTIKTMFLTFSKSANDLFLLAWATHFSASVYMDNDKETRVINTLIKLLEN